MALINPPPTVIESFDYRWRLWINKFWAQVDESCRETPTDTQTNLRDVNSSINTVDKFTGRYVWDSTNTKPVFAGGNTAAALWHNADGTTAHTPV